MKNKNKIKMIKKECKVNDKFLVNCYDLLQKQNKLKEKKELSGIKNKINNFFSINKDMVIDVNLIASHLKSTYFAVFGELEEKVLLERIKSELYRSSIGTKPLYRKVSTHNYYLIKDEERNNIQSNFKRNTLKGMIVTELRNKDSELSYNRFHYISLTNILVQNNPEYFTNTKTPSSSVSARINKIDGMNRLGGGFYSFNII